MAYRFLDHTADIAVEVSADTIEELFISSASAWRDTVIENQPEGMDEKRIYLKEITLEEVLVNFLDELNYLLYSKRWLFSSVKKLSLKFKAGSWDFDCRILGTELNESKHSIKEEIKAVTFHQMLIQKMNGQFNTKIVFDI